MERGSFSDSAGKIRRMISCDSAGNQTSHVDLTYTEAEDHLVWYSYPLDGGAVRKFVYEYDAAGSAVRWTEYDLDGGVLDHAVSGYGENENKVREAHFGPNGENSGYQTFAFDEQGRAMEKAMRLTVRWSATAPGNAARTGPSGTASMIRMAYGLIFAFTSLTIRATIWAMRDMTAKGT